MIICKKAYRVSRYALNKLSFLFCILFVSCDWVNDDMSGCETGTWLHFSYTYNILDVDAAYNQVEDLSILIFDNQGKFIERQDVDSTYLHQNSAKVEIRQPEGDYKVLVWGALSDTNYSLPELIVGQTQYKDVTLSLYKSDEASESASHLSDLFHCNLDSVTVTDYYNVIEAPLIKDTNHLSIIIQNDNYEEFDGDDFGIVMRSDNGVMDYENNLIANNYINYTPYNQLVSDVTNESLDGSVATSSVLVSYLNVLRLVKGVETTLTIVHKESNHRIIDISLIQYLLLTHSNYGDGKMGEQEYLDRQDSYSLIFFFEKSETSPSGYICTRVSVNGWIVRFNEIELEK